MIFKYPIINLEKTGENIKNLREAKNISVKELQDILGFTTPQAIYKWQWGESLPSIDSLVVLAKVFETTIQNILIITES